MLIYDGVVSALHEDVKEISDWNIIKTKLKLYQNGLIPKIVSHVALAYDAIFGYKRNQVILKYNNKKQISEFKSALQSLVWLQFT